MVSSRAATVEDYLAELPPERREVVAKVRALVRRHLPKGYVRSCLRFKKIEELPLEALGTIIASMPVDAYITRYEASRKKR